MWSILNCLLPALRTRYSKTGVSALAATIHRVDDGCLGAANLEEVGTETCNHVQCHERWLHQPLSTGLTTVLTASTRTARTRASIQHVASTARRARRARKHSCRRTGVVETVEARRAVRGQPGGDRRLAADENNHARCTADRADKRCYLGGWCGRTIRQTSIAIYLAATAHYAVHYITDPLDRSTKRPTNQSIEQYGGNGPNMARV